jgi:hypothetical protein
MSSFFFLFLIITCTHSTHNMNITTGAIENKGKDCTIESFQSQWHCCALCCAAAVYQEKGWRQLLLLLHVAASVVYGSCSATPLPLYKMWTERLFADSHSSLTAIQPSRTDTIGSAATAALLFSSFRSCSSSWENSLDCCCISLAQKWYLDQGL